MEQVQTQQSCGWKLDLREKNKEKHYAHASLKDEF
jgi:hypothetical protein